MSDTSMDNRMLALAGVAQALAQVRRIADTGQADAAVLATALDSVFRVDAASAEAVYGDASALRPGLLLLRSYFRNESEDALLPRLGLAVLQLSVLLYTSMVVLINFLVDLSYGLIDPRVRV